MGRVRADAPDSSRLSPIRTTVARTLHRTAWTLSGPLARVLDYSDAHESFKDIEELRVVLLTDMILIPETALTNLGSQRGPPQPAWRCPDRATQPAVAQECNGVALDDATQTVWTGNIIHLQDEDPHGAEVRAHSLLQRRLIRDQLLPTACRAPHGVTTRTADSPGLNLVAGLLLECLTDQQTKDAPSVIPGTGCGATVL